MHGQSFQAAKLDLAVARDMLNDILKMSIFLYYNMEGYVIYDAYSNKKTHRTERRAERKTAHCFYQENQTLKQLYWKIYYKITKIRDTIF